MRNLIEGESFLVLGDDFGFHPTTTAHVLRYLMGGNRFLWTHLMGLRAPELNFYTLQRAWGKLTKSMRTAGDGARENRTGVYTPFVWPLPPNRLIRWINCRTIVHGISRRLTELDIRHPIFFATYPHAAELIGCFGEKLVVYYCLDEYTEMPHFYRGYAREMEERLLSSADVVFATSAPLAASKAGPDRPVILLPQGVDFDHFGRFQDETPLEPSDLAGLPRPRFGFAGLLAPWVDTELLCKVARAYPTASLVMLGPVRTGLGPLPGARNAHVLGARSYAEVPRYLAHFDVGLIPFRINALTRSVNPLKLLEYLASGLPVISTLLPEVEALGELVYCARNHEEFISMIGTAIRDDSESQRRRRVEFARANSWGRRAEQLSSHLRRVLATRATH